MTIEELLEIEEIKNTRHLYSHYYDGNMLDELVSLFTDDAICEFGPEFGGDWVGKDQIRTNYHEYLYGSGRAIHSQMQTRRGSRKELSAIPAKQPQSHPTQATPNRRATTSLGIGFS